MAGWLGGWMDDVPFEDTHFWPESHLLCASSVTLLFCSCLATVCMLLDGTWSGTMNVHSWDGCAYTLAKRQKAAVADGKINIRNDVAADELPDSSRSVVPSSLLPSPSPRCCYGCFCCSCPVPSRPRAVPPPPHPRYAASYAVNWKYPACRP